MSSGQATPSIRSRLAMATLRPGGRCRRRCNAAGARHASTEWCRPPRAAWRRPEAERRTVNGIHRELPLRSCWRAAWFIAELLVTTDRELGLPAAMASGVSALLLTGCCSSTSAVRPDVDDLLAGAQLDRWFASNGCAIAQPWSGWQAWLTTVVSRRILADAGPSPILVIDAERLEWRYDGCSSPSRRYVEACR